MVREYQEQHDPEWLLLVDLWLPAQPGPADRERIETVISFVASCCATRARTGRNTGLQLLVCGRQFVSLGEPGQGLTLRDALESLAVAQGSPTPQTGHLPTILERCREEASRKLFLSSHPHSPTRLEELLRLLDQPDDKDVASKKHGYHGVELTVALSPERARYV